MLIPLRLPMLVTLCVATAVARGWAQGPQVEVDLLTALDLSRPSIAGTQGRYGNWYQVRDVVILDGQEPGWLRLPFDPQGRPYSLEIEVERTRRGALLLGLLTGPVTAQRSVPIALDEAGGACGPLIVDDQPLTQHGLARRHERPLVGKFRRAKVVATVSGGEARIVVDGTEVWSGSLDAARMSVDKPLPFFPDRQLTLGGSGSFRFTKVVARGSGLAFSTNRRPPTTSSREPEPTPLRPDVNASATRPPDTAPPNESGWLRLFNGNDLTGWKPQGNPRAVWTASGGVLTGRTPIPAAMLLTERDNFQNFRLHATTRLSEGSNSSLNFRDLRVLIGGTAPGEADKTGDLYAGQQLLVDATGATVGAGQWFLLEVAANGPRVEVFIDGKRVVEYEDRNRPVVAGPIGVMVRGGSTVRFREIALRDGS